MLTDRQAQVLAYIRSYAERNGVPPKLREIAAHLGIASRGTVHRYVRALAGHGLITVAPSRARGIVILDAGDPHDRPADASLGAPTTLPLAGRIAAGRPIEAVAGDERVDVGALFLGPDRFVLQVQGDSMSGDGILDGDSVVVERRDARDGDIVVALIDNDEATLKRLYRNSDGTVTLQPANAQFAPMRYQGRRVQVQGVVVGQFRAYR